METKTKICFKCKRELPVSEFYKNVANVDGLQKHCKDCTRAYDQKKKKKNAEDNTSQHLYFVYTNPELAKFKPRELIEELKSRGYHGKLSYTTEIVL